MQIEGVVKNDAGVQPLTNHDDNHLAYFKHSTMPPELPSKEVLKHVVDVHCHPTDSQITPDAIDDLPIIICAMATRQSDQALVANLARAHPEKVVPCFGQ